MEPTRKDTFVLPEWMLQAMREAVAGGFAESASALVREGVTQRLQELREAAIRREFDEAARDPEFLRDLEDSMCDFAPLDAESARMIP